MMTLGELNKNISNLGKQLKKVSSGMKINGADDGASEYVISERMRVRIHALEQDAANVQTGHSLLNVAEGAIQSQLDIMKTIKAKVIDADNDTNTDLDRQTIQKEISQGFDQINNITYETNYNSKLLLVGNKQVEEIYTWKILDKPETVPGSDKLNFIEDQYDSLDGQTGPFATLPFYSVTSTTAEPLLGSNTQVNLTGGTAGYYDDPQNPSPATFTFDFAGYTSSNAEGVGFYTASDSSGSSATYYVLTNNPSGKNYRHGNGDTENVTEINISGANTAGDIASKVAAAISSKGVVGSATASGSTVSVTTSFAGTSANNATVKGWSQAADSVEKTVGGGSSKKYGRTSAAATGLGNQTASGVPASSGTWVPPTYKDSYDPATDITTQVVDVPGHYVGGTGGSKASLTMNIAGVPTGSGFAIKGSGGTAYVRFVEGDSISRDSTGVYEIGKHATASDYKLCTWDTYNPNNDTDSYVRLSLSNGQLTLTSTYTGDKITVTDGFAGENGAEAIPATTKTVDFSAVTSYGGTVTNATGGVDRGAYHEGERASYTMDLTAYDTTDSDKLEEFISALKGKAISNTRGTVEFIDSKVPTSFDALRHLSGGTALDLNNLRTSVAGGQTVADAFIALMPSSYGYSDGSDTNAGTKGLKVTAYYRELAGNSEKIGISQGNMSSYTIDFKSYIENNNVSLPDGLHGTGFRLYCATCADQWFNFQFKSQDDPSDALRPPSGSSGADLKTTIIDIANVTDVQSLVDAIYTQGGDALEHIMNGRSHMLHFAADAEAGTLTVYDDRMFDLRTAHPPYRNLQEKGAKLADGVLDDVQKATRGVYVNELIIHHTDKASMNIHLKLPQTSMDHLFNYIPGVR